MGAVSEFGSQLLLLLRVSRTVREGASLEELCGIRWAVLGVVVSVLDRFMPI